MSLAERIAVARGEKPAALVIKNTRIFHLTTGEYENADIAITADGIIAGVGQNYHGVREIDGFGLTAVPGFVDAHVHLESSLMLPVTYESCVVRHGVTTAVCDPHELANIFGTQAFKFYNDAAERLTMDLKVRFSSCVPATNDSLETAGASISAADLAEWHKKYPKAALAELMNVPGVLYKVPEVLKKIEEFDFIDGHCPLLGGKDLNAYVSAGVRNCHESSILEEAHEKLLRGMTVFIREGSAARNLQALLPLMTLENSPYLAFCTDDRNPLDIMEKGHIDRMVARAIASGVSPLVAYRVVSLSAARNLGLTDRGLIAPGQRADIVLLSDVNSCQISQVLVHGVLADEISYEGVDMPDGAEFRNSVKCKEVTAEDFPMPTAEIQPVIGIEDGSLLTAFLKLPGNSPDVLPVAVLERHGRNGNIAHGLVKGFGMQKGALASSVGHDSHNICVVGTNSQDMAVAVNALRKAQGGFVVVADGEVKAMLPLPLAGIFSDQSADAIADQMVLIRYAIWELGCTLHEPFLQLAFIPLPVIPHLKLTDKGLVDVDKFCLLK